MALERNPILKTLNAIMNDSGGNLHTSEKVSVAVFGLRFLLVIFCFQKQKNV